MAAGDPLRSLAADPARDLDRLVENGFGPAAFSRLVPHPLFPFGHVAINPVHRLLDQHRQRIVAGPGRHRLVAVAARATGRRTAATAAEFLLVLDGLTILQDQPQWHDLGP